MWLELLKKYKSESEYMFPQPGTSASEIQLAENKLNIIFPQELKEFLLEVNGDKWLMFSVKEITENNLESRKSYVGVYDNLYEFLFIAGNGCGDYYAYEIKDGKVKTDKIVCWEHEENICFPVADNLMELIEKYYTCQI